MRNSHTFTLIASGCLVAITVPVCLFIYTATMELSGAREAMLAEVRAQVNGLRIDTFAEFDKRAKALEGQLSRVLDGDQQAVSADGRAPLRTLVLADINNQADGIKSLVNDRLADGFVRLDRTLTLAEGLRTDINAQATTLNATVAATTKPIAALAVNVQGITGQINTALPDFTDCYNDGFGNANCLFNRYQGVSKAFEQAMLKVPAMVTTFQATNTQVTGIATDFHDIVHQTDLRFFHPPPRTKKQQVVGFLKDLAFVGSRVYGGAK